MDQANEKDSSRIYGWLLIAFAMLSVLGVSHHPISDGGRLQDHLRSLSGGAMIQDVHGFIIAVMAAGFVGLCGLAQRLGLQRPAVLGGLVLMAFGMATMMSAGAINGFAVRHFASGYQQLRPDQIEAVTAMLRMSWAYNQAFASIGAVFWGGAVLCWSVALVGLRGAARWVGLFGILAGAVIGLGVLTGSISLHVGGLMLIVALLAAWSAAIGLLLLNGRLPHL